MKTKNRLIAMLLALIMVLSLMPMNVISSMAVSASDFTEPTIFVDSKYSAANSTVSVDVIVANNPGIAGATLTVAYDQLLTLTAATNGEAFANLTFTKPGSFSNPSKFLWDSESGETQKDGTILTLTFEVSEAAQADENLSIEISSNLGDFYDEDMETVNLQLVNGNITVIDYIPGDVNSDGVVNGKDVTMVRRDIVGGYDQTINEAAADVNEDCTINGKDVTAIRRFIVGGYDIVLKPSKPACEHQMDATEYKAATCTEDGNIAYWYCMLCDKYFKDAAGTEEVSLENTVIPAKGHTVVIDHAVAPTDSEPGHTEGSHCSECGKVIVSPEPIPVPVKEQYTITYNVSNGDLYLASQTIENPNQDYYTSDGLTLKNVSCPGYNFLGWYDLPSGSNAQNIKAITPGTKGAVELYAHWEKIPYKVKFDSPDIPVADLTYTVDEGVPLINPASQFGYTFVGWSNDNGFLVSRIKPGTIGNVTLHANWTSNRNKATSYDSYKDPYIIEDSDNGRFIFVYDIGKIDNVPLSVVKYYGNSEGIEINERKSVSATVNSETAQEIAETVSNATTRSSAWTLSSDWNKLYSAGNETDEIRGKTTVRTDSEGNVTGGNYFVSNSNGGSSYVSTSSGGSSSNSAKVTTEKSVGINNSYDTQTEKYVDAKLSVENKLEVGAGVSLPVDIVKVSADVKNTTTIGAEVSSGRKDNTASHADSSYSGYIGTYNESNNSSYYDTTSRNESNWNSTSGYEKSYQTSINTEISNAINEQITNKTTYSVQDAIGGSESKNESDTTSTTQGNEYVNSVRFNEENKTSEEIDIKQSASATGYYRLVNAGTVHVFAVVGYDVATCSYYTYTYNVLDDERHTYLDFSLADPNFKDCENGVVNFEVPYFVNEYVCALTGKTDGLQIGLDGKVTGYIGENETVVIPQYDSADNLDDTNSAIKVTSFTTNVFKGNTTIKTVVLPAYITEIPDNAFEGCTNLESVYAFGVTKIGSNAFKGCTNLKKFSVDNKVTVLGENAFEGAPEIMVNAANQLVADNAINCGANRIILNISNIDNKYSNKVINICGDTEYFALYSDGSISENLQLISSAEETVVNNIIFANNTDTPMIIDSPKVTLNRVTVNETPVFALILKNDNTELNLYSNVVLGSKRDNSVLCKSVSLNNLNPKVTCSLSIFEKALVCGEFIDSAGYLKKGEIITITQEEYDRYLTSSIINFDANGGTVNSLEKTVYHGQPYGELPTPDRKGYIFDGWYTAETSGEKITSDTVVSTLINHTLYAHWTLQSYAVTFNANGGSVSESSKKVAFGQKYGELPEPTREYYEFVGWYTEAESGERITSDSVFNTTEDITLYAHWSLQSFVVSFDANGGSVSPSSFRAICNNPLGTLPIPTREHYSFDGWYTESVGGTKITESNVYSTPEDFTLYAHWTAKQYTYDIVYKSTNGTNLGSSTITKTYGTTNTISAPSKSGYDTPSQQSIKWDTSNKTITFTYSPTYVATSQKVQNNGIWYYSGVNDVIFYDVELQYQNRTANSVQIRVVWTNKILANHKYSYYQAFNVGDINGVDVYYNAGKPDYQIVGGGVWGDTYPAERSSTAYSNWYTVPISTNATKITIRGVYWRDGRSDSPHYEYDINIPAY